jgi:hypothetical protein
VGQALSPANRSGSDQELAGESACPTFFHEVPKGQVARLSQHFLIEG